MANKKLTPLKGCDVNRLSHQVGQASVTGRSPLEEQVNPHDWRKPKKLNKHAAHSIEASKRLSSSVDQRKMSGVTGKRGGRGVDDGR